ncbi:hypothetical protein OQA88_6051 [Cercophora sp. LCS_1]
MAFARHHESLGLFVLGLLAILQASFALADGPRQRLSLNEGWKFQRSASSNDGVSYNQMKPWILPAAADYINDASKRARRPAEQPSAVSLAQATFDDNSWETLDLPHDWAVAGPFYNGSNAVIGGAMGRLPIHGTAWYRRKFSVEGQNDALFLEIDGAMSYAMVWLNGVFVGGWPYGYASFSLDLTPYAKQGENQLAIRLENAVDSSRYYPGAGIYRNVWLTKVAKTHVAYHGTQITTRQVSAQSATVDLIVQVENTGTDTGGLEVKSAIHTYDPETAKPGDKITEFPSANISLASGRQSVNRTVTLSNPKLWGPPPTQKPNLYIAVTTLLRDGKVIDEYTTPFGVRSVEVTPDGLKINNERIYLKGVNQHHDLGALGSAWNSVAGARQIEYLEEMGCNMIRTSHNPPAPELLDLADKHGILILDEIFDTWASRKVRNDFHLIFGDWSEADLRSFVRRDRNHPSVVIWSYGNEIAEQGGGANGAAAARRLRDIVRSEDNTRSSTVGMNNAGPDTAFTEVVDIIGLNYQGEGRGSGGATFGSFRSKYPNKMIFSTESSSAISTRGTYLFPVAGGDSITVSNSQGSDQRRGYVSAYELYAVSWGASPDKVFAAQDRFPYVGGENVWTGWDYLGEPTPFDSSRSSYFGIIDLAGFKKDRFYLYQARWNPTVKMAHILPHWNWPDRVGQVTPVHVFSSADQAELFLNGVSQGVQKRGQYQYRFRWDKVTYEPGELRVTTWKNGALWANATVRTTGEASQLSLSAYKDRASIKANGDDLSFISVAVKDEKGDVVPLASNAVTFSIQGPGRILVTDNGDPTDMVPFPSKERKAFNGFALAIVKANRGATGNITVTATARGLKTAEITLGVV